MTLKDIDDTLQDPPWTGADSAEQLEVAARAFGEAAETIDDATTRIVDLRRELALAQEARHAAELRAEGWRGWAAEVLGREVISTDLRQRGDLLIDTPPPGLGPPARPWTYCADALPTEAGRYRVVEAGSNDSRLLDFSPVAGWDSEGSVFPSTAYAWQPSESLPVPPLRPPDRSYLLTQGVPAEWLGAPEED